MCFPSAIDVAMVTDFGGRFAQFPYTDGCVKRGDDLWAFDRNY